MVKWHSDQLRQRDNSTVAPSELTSQPPSTDDYYFPYELCAPAPRPAQPVPGPEEEPP